MKKESKRDINVYSLTSREWEQFTRFNPKPESIGIEIQQMDDSSRKVTIPKSSEFSVMSFEAATFLAGIINE